MGGWAGGRRVRQPARRPRRMAGGVRGPPDGAKPDRAKAPRGTEAAAHQRTLDRRVKEALGTRSPAWNDLAARLPENVRSDRGSTRLTRHLLALANAGIAVEKLIDHARSEPRPLPDEHAADALWWRIVRHLGPATLPATRQSAGTLRPAWSPVLAELVGQVTADRIMADSAWPALVAAVLARPPEWSTEQLLGAVIDRQSSSVPVEDLCSTLVWRIATMTDAPQEPEDVGPAADEPTAGVTCARIVELNEQAMAHYEAQYPRSWATAYLQQRLHTDLTDTAEFRVGYAPPISSSTSATTEPPSRS
ncbi:hypothetical protein NOCA250029 [metagenome]|uniref:Uncharacterized protein n=1 Tax=metagenome TaxID=256318 RepID=A0A2P2C8Q1_9ZZZZ